MMYYSKPQQQLERSSFVCFELILGKYDVLSFHDKICVQRKPKGVSCPDRHQTVPLVTFPLFARDAVPESI